MEEFIKFLCIVYKFLKEFFFGLLLIIKEVGFINE